MPLSETGSWWTGNIKAGQGLSFIHELFHIFFDGGVRNNKDVLRIVEAPYKIRYFQWGTEENYD